MSPPPPLHHFHRCSQVRMVIMCYTADAAALNLISSLMIKLKTIPKFREILTAEGKIMTCITG